MDAIIVLLNESGRWLVAQLGRMSVELAILAGIVLIALYVLRVKSPALRHLFWGLLLAKPVFTFLVASPLSLYAFLWPPIPEVFYTQAPVVVQMEKAPVEPVVHSASVPSVETPRPVAPPLWRQIDRYGLVSAIWMLVASALGLRLLLGCAYVTFLRSTALTQRDGPLAGLVVEAMNPLRMRRRVRIATTRVAHGPVLAGIFRPVILLPESMAGALTPKQLKLVITHELAHAKRWDNLVLLIQRLAEMFFFFHPVVWFCGWMMRREAEAACDDMVVSAYGDADGAGAVPGAIEAAYADSLIRVAEMKCGITHRLLVNTFAAAESNFNRRIRRILNGRSGRMTLWLSLATGAALVLIGVLGLPAAYSSSPGAPAENSGKEAHDVPKQSSAKPKDKLNHQGGLEDLSAREILQRYKAGQSWQERFSIHIQELTTWERAASNPGQRDLGNVYTELDIHKDGNRMHWWPTRRRPSSTGKPEPYDGGENYFMVPCDGKDVCFRDIEPEWADCFSEDPMHEVRTQIGVNGGAGVFGWFYQADYAPLQDVLPPDKAQVAIEDVDGLPCYAVSCKTEKVTTKAWFAPDKGFALARCVIEQDASQLEGVIVKDKKGVEHTLTGRRQELKRVQFQEIDGHHIPMVLEMGDSFDLKDGGTVSRGEADKVTDVDLKPSFPADEFALKFKDGKKIGMRHPGGGLDECEWRQGKIVPPVEAKH